MAQNAGAFAAACSREKVDLVMRPTGGGALLHDEKTLTYSVIGTEKELGTIAESYYRICNPVLRAIRDCGVDAKFSEERTAEEDKWDACVARRSPLNDIVVNARKVSGNAQSRRSGAVLQHGSVFFDTDLRLMAELVGDESAVKKATTMKVHGAKSFKTANEKLEAELSKEFKAVPDVLSGEELREIDAFVQSIKSSSGSSRTSFRSLRNLEASAPSKTL